MDFQNCFRMNLEKSTYLINIILSSTVNFTSSEHICSKILLIVSNLKYLVVLPTHSKLKETRIKSLKYIFLGYGEEIEGYRLWLKEQKDLKVIISRNGILNEESIPFLSYLLLYI